MVAGIMIAVVGHRTRAKPASRKVLSSKEEAPRRVVQAEGILYFAEGLF
jgi:hypothetical protein